MRITTTLWWRDSLPTVGCLLTFATSRRHKVVSFGPSVWCPVYLINLVKVSCKRRRCSDGGVLLASTGAQQRVVWFAWTERQLTRVRWLLTAATIGATCNTTSTSSICPATTAQISFAPSLTALHRQSMERLTFVTSEREKRATDEVIE